MPLRIVVGPTEIFIERHGKRSATHPLTEKDGPSEVREIAKKLWEDIRRECSFRVWIIHRLRMAIQRQDAAWFELVHPDLTHAGPKPWIIATRPWNTAACGEWTHMAPGVVSRLVRGGIASPCGQRSGV